MKKLNIGLVGRSDHDNFGDSLMFAFYVHYLEKNNANVYILEASDIFMTRLTELGFICKNILLRECNILDKVIFVGGGYFGQPDIKTKVWLNNFKKESYFYNIAKYLVDINVPYYIHGVEVGPLDDKECLDIVKYIFDNSQNVVVRNLASKKYLDHTIKCKSFFLRDVVLGVTSGFSEDIGVINIPNDDTCSHLIIHGTGKFFKKNPISSIFRKRLTTLIKKNSFKKVTILFDQSTYPELVIEAKIFCQSLNENCKAAANVVEYNGIYSVLNSLRSASHIITTKLHIGVVGLSFGKNVFCISSMEKNKRFYEEVFSGKGRVNLVKAILIGKLMTQPKFVCGKSIPVTERQSSLDNILKLTDFLGD